jgi:hypothetical protein
MFYMVEICVELRLCMQYMQEQYLSLEEKC